MMQIYTQDKDDGRTDEWFTITTTTTNSFLFFFARSFSLFLSAFFSGLIVAADKRRKKRRNERFFPSVLVRSERQRRGSQYKGLFVLSIDVLSLFF
jgi:hypothetical protein